jgi:hypothetical protein
VSFLPSLHIFSSLSSYGHIDTTTSHHDHSSTSTLSNYYSIHYFKMDSYTDSHRSIKSHAAHKTGFELEQERQTRTNITFQVLYDGSSLERYPGFATPSSLPSVQVSVFTTE